MTVLKNPSTAMSGFADREARQFKLIFVASLIVFLVVGAVARLLPRRLSPWSLPRDSHRSVWKEAKAAANRFIPFAFMG
jgi:hypothetical protein